MGNSIEKELRELRLERENDRRTHQEEIRQMECELEKKNQEISLLEKINPKRSKLKQKKPGDSGYAPKVGQFPNRLFISLFGDTGAGKTSLISSLRYAIDGVMQDTQRIQKGYAAYQGPYTLESLEVVLTDHLSVIDNRGINSEKANDTVVQADVIRQKEGTYKRGAVTWQSIAPAEGKETDAASYCSIVVFSAHHANVVREYESFIRRLREWQGHFPLAVITHVDEVSSKDVRLALQTGGIGEIYEVANVTSGMNGRDKLNTEHQFQLLQLLETCLKDGDKIFMHRQGFENGE